MIEPSRWLLVVHQERLDLYQHLQHRFAEVPFVELILDRRKHERRQVQAPIRADARQRDRRHPATPKEREQWALFGYRLVRRPEARSP